MPTFAFTRKTGKLNLWSAYWPSTNIRVVLRVFAMWRSIHLSDKMAKINPQRSISFLSAKRNHLNLHISYFQNSIEDRRELTGVGLYRFGGREEQKVPRQPPCIHKHRQAYSCLHTTEVPSRSTQEETAYCLLSLSVKRAFSPIMSP